MSLWPLLTGKSPEHEASVRLVLSSFSPRRSPWFADAALVCCTEWKDKHEGQNMPLQTPHVSVCDSHNELPQSKHCVLAVLEQGKPSASATFRTSTTSQRLIFAPLTAQSL
jgi:hypothetical protein